MLLKSVFYKIRNSELFFYKFEKMSQKMEKIRVFLRKFSLIEYWLNPLIKFQIYLKWVVLNSIFFVFNGFFIYIAIHGTKNPNFLIQMFSWGATLYFFKRIIVQAFQKLIGGICTIKKIKFKYKANSWDIYRYDEYKKRGILYEKNKKEGIN